MTLRSSYIVLSLFLAACADRSAATADTATAVAQSSAAAQPVSSQTPSAQDTSLNRADLARIMGSPSAKVWFVMSSDFQCPFCREFHHDLWKRIEKDYVATGKIRVAFLNHPMPFHQLAVPAAEAAMCAGKQDRFWQMHDGLFETQERWVKSGNPQPTFDSLATSLGLRMPDWRTCMTSHATRALVESDFARSSRGGVTGTPSFFIGDGLAIVGIAPYGDFRRTIDSVLARSGGR